MSDQIKITLPKLGESIVSATVVQWFKKVGDPVALDEPLLEVSTDKVNSEIPSPSAGILTEILALADVEVGVGEPLAVLQSNGTPVLPPVPTASSQQTTSSSEAADFLSPSVLRLLREKGIALSEIEKIPHTGQGGRLCKKDVEGYAPSLAPQMSSCALKNTERVKMSSLRKAIADNMVKSFYEAPHASLVTEVDVTEVLKMIQKQKQSFFEQTGAKLTITAYVAQAMARALQAFPLLNSSLDGDTIVVKKFVNLGIAVSVDQGVMVPVLPNCEQLSLAQIAKGIADLAEKTRSQTLSPKDVQEGSITLTNFGMTGTLIGVPIIRYPEVAIIGVGAIVKKVIAMADDSIAIRSCMMISLTFDHRVLDGLYGCGFLNALKKHIENYPSAEE